MARIIVEQGGKREEYELGQTVTIGRSPDNNIHITDAIAGKEHAIIVRDAQGRFMLRDRSTLTGTFIRGEQVREPRELVHGDEIAIGQTRLLFESMATQEMPVPPSPLPDETPTRSPALLALLADPTNVDHLVASALELVRASFVELSTPSADGTLLARHRAKRTWETGYGPSPTVRNELFPKVLGDKQPVLIIDSVLDAHYADSYTVMNGIWSVMVAPVVWNDTVLGVLYAHQQRPPKSAGEPPPDFNATDLALLSGIAKLAALALHADEQARAHMRSAMLARAVPPALANLDMKQAHHISEVYFLYSGLLGEPPDSAALRAAQLAVDSLSPIERIALAGRLLEKAATAEISDVGDRIRAALEAKRP